VFYDHVEPGTVIPTDEHRAYRLLDREGFVHGVVNHSREEWANTDEHGNRHHTNSLEGFWKLFKDSVRSTHIHVSSKHMQSYLNEFTFRSNHRAKVNGMFDLLVSAV
jgi:transposase-like protein